MNKFWTTICFSLLIGAAAPALAEKDGKCRSNQNCDFGLYCEKPVGKCKAEGSCAIRPEVCTDDYQPVCGCDGQTYSNACNAARAGVSVAKKGKCKGSGETAAHCLTNENCDFGLFCEKADGACKGPGVCEIRPEACPDLYDPVCGCDHQTYSNSCYAHRAGVSVQHQGECERG